MNNTVGLYSAERAVEISRLIDQLKHLRSGLGGDDNDNDYNSIRYVMLTEDLKPATDPKTGYTQASFIFLNDALSPENRNIEDSDGEDPDKVTNRYTDFSASSGDVLLVCAVASGDEWSPITLSGGKPRHGIVVSVDGCGHYQVELGQWTGLRSRSGSGVGGSGSGSGSIDMNCDPCQGATVPGSGAAGGGSGTGCGDIIMAYPPCPVTGNGVIVSAYHRASCLIPLVPGTACLLQNLGDVDGGSSGSNSGNSSGIGIVGSTSGSNSGSRIIWQILDGVQEHGVQYRERWDCCNPSGPRMLGRTPVYGLMKECAEQACDECPPVGSGGV